MEIPIELFRESRITTGARLLGCLLWSSANTTQLCTSKADLRLNLPSSTSHCPTPRGTLDRYFRELRDTGWVHSYRSEHGAGRIVVEICVPEAQVGEVG